MRRPYRTGDRVEVIHNNNDLLVDQDVRIYGYLKGERGVIVEPNGMAGVIVRFDGSEITQSVPVADLRVLDIVDLIGEV